MYFLAPHAATRMNGTHSHPATGRPVAPRATSETATGTTSCATAVPRLPPAALSPSAQPFSRTG